MTKKIKLLFAYILGTLFKFSLFIQNNIKVNKNVRFKGIPYVYVTKGSYLEIGEGVLIDSSNIMYHLNMYGPTKLIADRKGAIIKIGKNSRIHGTCIHAYKEIIIGNNCLIAANTNIIDGNGHDLSFGNVINRINTFGDSKPIKIEDNVWIGANVVILPGITIGMGSVIAAGSVVNSDIPEMCLAGGNPIKILKKFN